MKTRSKMNRIWLGAIVAAAGLVVVGCDDDGGTNGTGGTGGGPLGTGGTGGNMSADMVTLNLSFDGLEDLGDDYVYEGWFIINDAPVSTGVFSVDAEGNLDPETFDVPREDAEAATRFVLSIEPAEDDDPAPAATKVLAGDIEEGEADLTIGDAMAIGDDFESASGNFFLATPTSEADDDNQNGIWMFAMGEDNPALNLVDLSDVDGWTYEGWVVDITGDAPQPISTGTFDNPDGADSNGGGPGAGPEPAPNYPGEDFVEGEGNPRDLTPDDDETTHRVVISIEPVPDNSPAPFRLKPLMADIGADLAPTLQDFSNMISDNTITGTASIEE